MPSPLTPFIGRHAELAFLDSLLAQSTLRPTLLGMWGRRQIGKSRLLTEFVESRDMPFLFLTGTKNSSTAGELRSLQDNPHTDSRSLDLDLLRSVPLSSWENAFRLIAASLPADRASVIVLDEFPWMVENDPGLEGTLQKMWDRVFERLPVLFILVGSDLAMMRRLGEHGRPLFGRMREMRLDPLSLDACAAFLPHLGAPEVVEARVLTGGYPRLMLEWERGEMPQDYLRRQLAEAQTPWITLGERILAAEFDHKVNAEALLKALGSGERTFKGLALTAELPQTTLFRSLQELERRAVIAADVPVSAKPSKLKNYRVEDSYLRSWLRFAQPTLATIERGRPDLAWRTVSTAWQDFMGLAVEPLIRSRLLTTDLLPYEGIEELGAWWPRTNDPEVDLVGVARGKTTTVRCVGSIKWRKTRGFDPRDAARLAVDRTHVPGGAEAPMVGVSRLGGTVEGVHVISAEDLVTGS